MWFLEIIIDFVGNFLMEKIIGYFVGNINEINNPKLITEIINKSFITVANEFGYTIENSPTFPAFIKYGIIENEIKNGLKIFVYKKKKEWVGCVGYTKDTEDLYKIKRLAVLPEYRHLGIGKRLLKYNESKIKRNGGKIVEVHIVDNNEKLKQWYIKYGYKVIDIEEIKGLPFKVCKMQKTIKEK